MTTSCESCGSEDLSLVIHEVRLGIGNVVYSALKCSGCKVIYPLQELAKGTGAQVRKDAIVSMLKQT
jgi:hypothetical protein